MTTGGTEGGMMETLRACPFCGSGAVGYLGTDGVFRIICTMCDTEGPPEETTGKAADSWNIRADNVCDAEIAALKEDAEIGRLVRGMFDGLGDIRCLRTSQGKVAVCQTLFSSDGSANPVYFGDTLLEALRKARGESNES